MTRVGTQRHSKKKLFGFIMLKAVGTLRDTTAEIRILW